MCEELKTELEPIEDEASAPISEKEKLVKFDESLEDINEG